MKRAEHTIERVDVNFRSKSGERVTLAADLWHPGTVNTNNPTILYMPGFGSVRNGEKAVAFGKEFTKAGCVFIAFEPRGHGASSGAIEGVTLDRQIEDLHHVVLSVKKRGQRIAAAGSSLGALTMAAYLSKHPRAFCSLVGIGAAFGFFERWRRVAKSKRPPGLTDEAIESGKAAASELLGLKITIPVLLWHGMKDDAVAWRHVAEFAARARGFVELRLMNHGDHRLTDWKDRMARESREWMERVAGK